MNENKPRILMVEDEEQVMNANCRMLRRRGYDVRTAQTAAEAYHQIESELPDLLILDIMLPDGNGLDICRRFREKVSARFFFSLEKVMSGIKWKDFPRAGIITLPNLIISMNF